MKINKDDIKPVEIKRINQSTKNWNLFTKQISSQIRVKVWDQSKKKFRNRISDQIWGQFNNQHWTELIIHEN